MNAPRLSDRMRRPDTASTLPELLRAVADPQTPLESIASHEVLAATASARDRMNLRGAYQTGLAIPFGAFLRDLTSTGGTSAGGALVGSQKLDPQSSMRPFNVMADAGLRVVPLENALGAVGVPSVTTAPVASWVATEGADVPNSDAVLGMSSPVPRRLGFQFFVSWRLLTMGGALFDDLIRTEVGQAVGRALDAATLGGSGASGQPQGLATLAGVNATSGTTLAHAGLLAMRKNALTGGAREDRLRWIATPTVQETLGARERSTNSGRYLWDDGAVLGLPATSTASAPSATLLCGDFSLVTLYVFGPIELIFDRRSLSTGGKVSVVANMYCDLSVARAAAFSVASAIT